MREIWILKGPWWRLPITAFWDGQEDVATIEIGTVIPMLKRQQAEALALVKSVGEEKNGSVFCLRSMLVRIAEKFRGNDPEESVIWNPPFHASTFRTPKINVGYKFSHKKIYQKFATREEMFTILCKEGYFKTHEHAEVVYNAICKTMLHMLLNREKSIDLGFCELHPLPYRGNWREIMRHKQNKASLHLNKHGDREQIGVDNMMYEFFDDRMFAFIKESKIIQWNLFVTQSNAWYEMNRRVEMKKRASCRRDTKIYTVLCKEAIKRNLQKAKRIYEKYLAQIRIQALRVFLSDRLDKPSLNRRPTDEKEIGTLMAPVETLSLPVFFDDRPGGESKSPVVDLSEASEEWVREMSDLFQEENVRNKGEDVDESEDGEE